MCLSVLQKYLEDFLIVFFFLIGKNSNCFLSELQAYFYFSLAVLCKPA